MKISDCTLRQHVKFLNRFGKELEAITNEYIGLITDAVYHYKWYVADLPQDDISVILPWFKDFIANPKIDTYLTDCYDLWGNKWAIQAPIQTDGQLTKEQYDIVNSIALVYADLQDGHNEAWYELCACYLRPVNEPFCLSPERIKQMESLPLDIAMCVKEYVTKSISFYNGHSASFDLGNGGTE
jgi:hypothetical protein